jgi:hypothetical protein
MAEVTGNGKNDNVKWSLLKNIWPFIVIVFLMGGSYASQTYQTNRLREDLTRIEAAYKEADTRLTDAITDEVTTRSSLTETRNKQYLDIQTTLVAIQKDIEYIRVQLDAHAAETP